MCFGVLLLGSLENLVKRPFYLDEEGVVVAGDTTRVGSNGVVCGSGMIFFNSRKVG